MHFSLAMRPPEFWSRGDAISRTFAALLQPVAWFYGATVRWKFSRARPFRPSAKVVCVGNLTVGGTGKTPLAIAIARRLMSRGARVAFLSRGYGGQLTGPHIVSPEDSSAEVGDEPLLLARVAPAIVARDRAAAARLADAQHVDVLVMDDGLQNFSIAKDLSFVVVDGETWFGNGQVIPAGPLREPVEQGARRADALIVVGGALARAAAAFVQPVLQASLAAEVANVRDKPVVAFAGIGRPEKFLTSLRDAGASVIGWQVFADHHRYTDGEIAALKTAALERDAVLVTTEKDFVRLSPQQRPGIAAVPATIAFDDVAELDALLDRVFPRALPRADA